jgi:hypothetical protein
MQKRNHEHVGRHFYKQILPRIDPSMMQLFRIQWVTLRLTLRKKIQISCSIIFDIDITITHTLPLIKFDLIYILKTY